MREPEIIKYREKTIIYLNFSDLRTKEEICSMIDKCRAFIAKQPLKSALTLTNFSGMYFNTEVFNLVTSYAKGNSPYVRKGAVVGLNGLMQIFYNGFAKLSGRDIKAFSSTDEAKEYLISNS